MNAGPVSPDGTPLPSVHGPLAWSLDGRKVLVAGSVGPLVPLVGWPGPAVATLLDVASASVDWRRQDPAATSVLTAAFAPDGATVAVVYQQAYVNTRLDLLTMPYGAVLRSTPVDGPCETVGYSPDSRLLAFSSWYGMRLVETATGAERLVHRAARGAAAVAVFSPDSRRIAVTDGAACVLFDTADGTRRWTAPHDDPARPIMDMRFAPDGQTLVVVHEAAAPAASPEATEHAMGLVRTLSADTGAELSTTWCEDMPAGLLTTGQNKTMRLSRDGTSVAKVRRWFGVIPAPSSAGVWSVADGRPRFPPVSLPPISDIYGSGANPAVRLSPDRRWLAVGYGRTGPGLLVLDAASGEVVLEELGADVEDLAFSDDGARLAVNDGTGLRRYTVAVPVPPPDPAAPVAVCALGRPVQAVAATSGGLAVAGACAGDTATLLHAESGQPLATKTLRGVLSAIRFTADGRNFVTAGSDGTVSVFGVLSVAKLWSQQHRGPVAAVEFVPGPRGDLIAAVGLPDRSAGLHGGDTGDPLWTSQHPGPVGPIAVDPSGRWVATGCTDGVTRLLARDTGRPVPSTAPAGGGPVAALCAAPGGQLLAAGNDDGGVTLIDPGTGARVGALTRPFPVTAVAFGADGRLLACGDEDGTVCLNDVTDPTLPPVASRRFAASVRRLAANPGGGQFAVVTDDGVVSIVDAGDLTTVLAHPHPGAVLDAAFSPDGALLVTGCDDGIVRVFRRPPR